jgi:hypothetical protein
VDATGLETRHISRYFVWRQGKRHKRYFFPKLTAVVEIHSHLYLAAHASKGPSQDSPQLRPAVRPAQRRCRLDTLLGDSGYDGEHQHVWCRQRQGIRLTVFALNRRNTGRRWPPTRYRRQMKRYFRRWRQRRGRRLYGQRWQAESAFSRSKRRLGSALRARIWPNQKKEIVLRVLTHNLLILGHKT